MKTDEIHIGSLIRQKLDESPLTVTEFAHRINKTRENVYDIFKRQSIHTELLRQISKTLKHDFSEYFRENHSE